MQQLLVTRKRLACISLGLMACLWAGAPMAQQVDIQDNFFSPQVIEIEAGQTVTWVNQGQAFHTATSNDALWDSGFLQPGQQFSHTFNDPGTFSYFCQPHGPSMSGTVVVTGVVVTHLVSTNVIGPGSISPTSADVEEGETAEFTLTADFGASIDGASGCGGSLVGNIYTTGPIVGPCTVSASFSLDTYTVSTSVTGPGSIDPDSAIVEHGQTTEFTLTPDENASLDEVSGCDGNLDDNIYTTGPIVGPCTVSASFSLDTYTVSTSVTGPGSIDPGSAIVEHGQTTEFTLTPDENASLDEASGCDGNLDNNIYTTGPIVGPCTVSASFSLDTYTVSTSVTGPGSIDPDSAIVEHGQTTEFTLTPDENASLDEVSGCDGNLDDNIYTTGPIVGPCTVSASFSLDSHTVSTNVTGPGSIDPDNAEVEHGATATFTLQPEPDAVIDSVSGCDGSLEDKSYTTGPITGPCIVNAVFIIEGDPIFRDRFELEAKEP